MCTGFFFCLTVETKDRGFEHVLMFASQSSLTFNREKKTNRKKIPGITGQPQ